jgi:hypothetical protein
MLRWAAEFNSARSGAAEPDPDFLAGLRSRILAAVVDE